MKHYDTLEHYDTFKKKAEEKIEEKIYDELPYYDMAMELKESLIDFYGLDDKGLLKLYDFDYLVDECGMSETKHYRYAENYELKDPDQLVELVMLQFTTKVRDKILEDFGLSMIGTASKKTSSDKGLFSEGDSVIVEKGGYNREDEEGDTYLDVDLDKDEPGTVIKYENIGGGAAPIFWVYYVKLDSGLTLLVPEDALKISSTDE